MRGLNLLFSMALCGALAGCIAPQQPAKPKPPGVTLIPDQAGLGIAGKPTRIDFGRATEGVIPTLTRHMGQGREIGLEGCANTVTRRMAWGDLILNFEGTRFTGWQTPEARAGRICAA